MEEDNIREFTERGFTILHDGNIASSQDHSAPTNLQCKWTALSPEELNALHEEADSLTNYLLDEGYDLVNDLGCIVGRTRKSCCMRYSFLTCTRAFV